MAMANRVTGGIPLRVEYTDVHPSEQKYATAIQIIKNSFLDPSYQPSWTVHSLRTVKNFRLYQLYQAKARDLRQQDRDTNEHDMFTCYKTMDLIRNILENGLQTRQSSFNFLGDSKRGVNLCKHADIQLKAAENTGQEECYLIMYKVMLGKALPVLPSPDNSQLQPVEGYDSHVSNMVVNQHSPLGQQAIRSQVFCYEYINGQLSSCPRHVLPYVVVCYRRNRSSVIPPTPSMPVLSMQLPQQQQHPHSRPQLQPPPPPLVQMAPAPGVRHANYYAARSESQAPIPNFQPRLPPRNPFVPPNVPMMQGFPNDISTSVSRMQMVNSSAIDHTRTGQMPPSTLNAPGMLPPMSRAPYMIPTNANTNLVQQRPGMRLPYITPPTDIGNANGSFSSNQTMALPVRPPVANGTDSIENSSLETDPSSYVNSFPAFSSSRTNDTDLRPDAAQSNGMTIPIQMPPTSGSSHLLSGSEDNAGGIGMRLPIVIQPEEPDENHEIQVSSGAGSHMRLPTILRDDSSNVHDNVTQQNLSSAVSSFNINQPPAKEPESLTIKSESNTKKKKCIVIEPIIIDEEEDIDDMQSLSPQGTSIPGPSPGENNELQPVLDLTRKNTGETQEEPSLKNRQGGSRGSPYTDDELVIDDFAPAVSHRDTSTDTDKKDTPCESKLTCMDEPISAHNECVTPSSMAIKSSSHALVLSRTTMIDDPGADEDNTLPDLQDSEGDIDSLEGTELTTPNQEDGMLSQPKNMPKEMSSQREITVKAKKKRKRTQSPWLTTKPKKRKLNKKTQNVKKRPDIASVHSKVFKATLGEEVCQENTVYRVCKDGSLEMYFDVYSHQPTSQLSTSKFLEEIGPSKTLIEIEKDLPEMNDFLIEIEEEFSPCEVIHLGDHTVPCEPPHPEDLDDSEDISEHIDSSPEQISVETEPEEPQSPPVDAYHDFSFEMPSVVPTTYDDNGYESPAGSTGSQVDISLDKVKLDQRYQPKVVVEDITSSAKWGSYVTKSKDESSDDDVMNLKITCVQSLISSDNGQDSKTATGWENSHDHLTAEVSKGTSINGSEHSSNDSMDLVEEKIVEVKQSRLSDVESMNLSIMQDNKSPVKEKDEIIKNDSANISSTNNHTHDVVQKNTTELDDLLKQRTELQESLKELDDQMTQDDTDSAADAPTFDPSSIEKLGTKLSILRDLEEANHEKKKKCLAKLSEVQKTLKRKKCDKKVEVTESALDLFLDESDVSSDNESEDPLEDAGRNDQNCSQMKPNGKGDNDSDEDNSSHKQRRTSLNDQKHTRSTTSKSGEESTDRGRQPTTTTTQEPYSKRLRSNSRTPPEKNDTTDIGSKRQKRKKKNKSGRRRKRKSRQIVSRSESDVDGHVECSTTESSHEHHSEISTECKDENSKDPILAPKKTEQTESPEDNQDVVEAPNSVDTASGAAQSDTIPNSEKWAETCERIFMGEKKKEDESCLYDGYTEMADSPKPCQDPTQWLSTLIRLNQKGKGSASSGKTEKPKSTLKTIESEPAKAAQDEIKSARTSTDKSDEDHVLQPETAVNKDSRNENPEQSKVSAQKIDTDKDVYVSHPKYPAMPPGMKIKRTSSVGNRSTVRKSTEEATSQESKNMSKEEVSELVSKALKLLSPNQSSRSANVDVKEPTPVTSKVMKTKSMTRGDQPHGHTVPSMTRESQLHGYTVPRPNLPLDPRSQYPQPYKKPNRGDPRTYGRGNTRPSTQSQKSHASGNERSQTFSQKPPGFHGNAVSGQQNLMPPSRIGTSRLPSTKSVAYGGKAQNSLDINAVEANTIALLAFSAINTASTEEQPQIHRNQNYRSQRPGSCATSPRIRTDSASSASDSVILSPLQTTSPLASPDGRTTEMNRDPRRHSLGSMPQSKDHKSTVSYTGKPEIDASLAIEKDMGCEAKSKVNKLWETSICAKPNKGPFLLKQKSINVNQETRPTSSHLPQRVPSDKHSRCDSQAKNDPWNFIVYDFEVPHGTCYKRIEGYGKCKTDPRLRLRQHTLDGKEEHVGRKLTKYTSKIPLVPTLKPEIVSHRRSSNNVATEKGPDLSHSVEKTCSESHQSAKSVGESPDHNAEKETRSNAKKSEATEKASHTKGHKAGSMWSNMLDKSRHGKEERETSILSEEHVGGHDDSTRLAMMRVWELNVLEWESLNREMSDILHEHISEVDDSMLFNDPTKGLTSERRKKLMASESLNCRVANELKIEDNMQSLLLRITQLRQEADHQQKMGIPDQDLKRLRQEIKVMDVRYEKFFKDLEGLNRFHKSSVVEVLPDIFRLPQEMNKYISVEGNMLFLVSTLNEADCKKLYALKEAILSQKKLVSNPKTPYGERQQGRLRLGWLHGERKETLCQICINMPNNKESVLQKLSSRILWCRKGEQALHDNGSSDELIGYIEERIANLELYLKILRFVQRTENGVWVFCKTAAARTKEGVTEKKFTRQRSRTPSCESKGKESAPNKVILPKAAGEQHDSIFDHNVCTDIPGSEAPSTPLTISEVSEKPTSKIGTDSEIGNDTGIIPVVQLRKEKSDTNVPSKGALHQKTPQEEKMSVSSDSRSSTPEQHPTNDITTRNTGKQPSRECQVGDDCTSLDMNVNTDSATAPVNMNTDAGSVKEGSSCSGNTSPSKSIEQIPTEQIPTDQVCKHTMELPHDCGDEEGMKTGSICRDIDITVPADDTKNSQSISNKDEFVDPSSSRTDQNMQIGDVQVHSDPLSSSRFPVDDTGVDPENIETSSGEQAALMLLDHTKHISDTRNVVLRTDAEDTDETSHFKGNGFTEQPNIPDKDEIDRKVSSLLAILKACSKGDDAIEHKSGENLDSTSTDLTDNNTKSTMPTPIGDECSIQDMDISDISDSCQIEVCSASVSDRTANVDTEPCDQYGDVDWRPVLESSTGLMIGKTTDISEGSTFFDAQSTYKEDRLISVNNNDSQLTSKEDTWEDSSKAQKKKSKNRWDIKPDGATHAHSVSSSGDAIGSTITERRTIRVDNTPWRSDYKSQTEHRTELTNSSKTCEQSAIKPKTEMFRKASDILQSSSPQHERNIPDVLSERKGNPSQMRKSPVPELRTERKVTITRGHREASPSSSVVSGDRRSSSLERIAHYDDDSRQSRSRSPTRPKGRRSQNVRHHPLHNSHDSSSTSSRSVEGSYGRASTSGAENISCHDPTIRRILSGDPVLIEMLSHPTTTTRLASMLPNVQDRETVFKLAREVQNDLLLKERRSLNKY